MTKQSTYTSYEQLPLFLDAKLLSALLGISRSGVYELMHEAGFPSVRIGSRIASPQRISSNGSTRIRVKKYEQSLSFE